MRSSRTTSSLLANAVPHRGEARYKGFVAWLQAVAAAYPARFISARITVSRAAAMPAEIFGSPAAPPLPGQRPPGSSLSTAFDIGCIRVTHYRVETEDRDAGQRTNHEVGERAIFHYLAIG